jgi:hypothetical protein
MSESQLQESSFEAQQVVELARNNLDFLAGLAMPVIFKYFFPAVFKAIWSWLCETVQKTRDFSQLAIGLPRGFGKTIVIKLFVLYCILFTKKQFILVISENESKAVSILSDVCDMLDEPNVKAVFGDWRLGIETDQQAKKKFGFRGRNILLKAAGAGTGIRGITEKNIRPDVMIFDDIQSREDSESDVLSTSLEKWMVSTAMKAKSPEGCLFVFIANMYPTKGSLLRKLKKNPNWIKFIAGGILQDGTSLWEELQPIEQLLREFQNDLAAGHPEIFYAEVLNDENATVNNLVDISKIPPYPLEDSDIPEGKFIVIDPSGDKITSDAVSIGYFVVYMGVPYLRKLIEARLSPGETIRQALILAVNNGVSIIAIESNAYQASLNYWFKFICDQQGIIGIQPVEVYSGRASKNSRIIQMFQQLVKGEVGIHPECFSACSLQISQFNPMKTNNTDGLLDLLTYSPKVLELYGTEIYNSTVIQEQESAAQGVLEDNFCF